VLAINCNDPTVAVALWATRTLPAGKRLQEWRGFLDWQTCPRFESGNMSPHLF
jgi:hypothetical protein